MQSKVLGVVFFVVLIDEEGLTNQFWEGQLSNIIGIKETIYTIPIELPLVN